MQKPASKLLKKKSFIDFIKAPPLWFFLVAALAFVGVKLVLVSAQQVFLNPDEALIDDMLMYDMAVSISKGDWLGEYNYLTLSKHSFFSLWLAGLHILRIPYLLGGHLLWTVASACGALAFVPVFKKHWQTFALFVLLLFNPAAVANPSPHAYITRVYRDNIFPSLCLLCIAGIVGYAFRYKEKLGRNIFWPVLAGVSFAAAWLCREDGWWLLPFVAVASFVVLVFVLREKTGIKQKIKQIAPLALPFILLVVGLCSWAGMNNAYYGRFIISDFSSGEFADAVGAMTRIQLGEWDSKRSVPLATREYLYEKVPEFAQLEPYLESEWFIEKTNNHESGGFYWVLREAAGNVGVYDTPQTAQAFYQKLAADINALCDSGAVPALPRRSSVSPPIRSEYILPVLKEGVHGLWFCATFEQCEPYSMRSVAAPQKLEIMEDFLREKSLTAAQEGTDKPYFHPLARLMFFALQSIRFVYTVLLPLALLLGFFWLLVSAGKSLKRKKQTQPQKRLLWWVMLGIILCTVLRAMMVAFVAVSSFSVGTYVMYLASIHPLLIIFGTVGTIQFSEMIFSKHKKSTKNEEIFEEILKEET